MGTREYGFPLSRDSGDHSVWEGTGAMAEGNQGGGKQGCRRARQAGAPRRHRMVFRLSDEELARFKSGARRAGLSLGAYAALAVTSDRPGAGGADAGLLREAMTGLDRAAQQVHRIGVNLNQAVARLHATGQYSEDLRACAQASLRVARRVEQAAETVQQMLR